MSVRTNRIKILNTVFLDEIGNLSYENQIQLLRALQERKIKPVGSNKEIDVDIRIITATNEDLREAVKNGTFREDLYYRLNVVSIETKSLRERKNDISPLISTFLKKYGLEYGKPNSTISEKATEILTRHSWPGNVRELENIIQRLIIMSDSEIDVSDIPEYLKYQHPSENQDLKSLKDIEKDHILKVLHAVGDNKTKAAEILQIDRKTLRQKLL